MRWIFKRQGLWRFQSPRVCLYWRLTILSRPLFSPCAWAAPCQGLRVHPSTVSCNHLLLYKCTMWCFVTVWEADYLGSQEQPWRWSRAWGRSQRTADWGGTSTSHKCLLLPFETHPLKCFGILKHGSESMAGEPWRAHLVSRMGNILWELGWLLPSCASSVISLPHPPNPSGKAEMKAECPCPTHLEYLTFGPEDKALEWGFRWPPPILKVPT